MNQRIACFIGIIISLFGLFSLSPSMDLNSLTTDNRPATASQVDLTKFAKIWYEQAHTPFYYEKGCTDSTSKYTLKNDGTLFLEDKCLKNGEIVGMEARAVPEDSTNSKLKIQPYKYLDIGSQYWIFKIDQEYTYFVGGKPDLRDFWIYSSEPKMDQDLYDSIIKELKKDDFPVERLIRSDHS